MFPMRTLRLAEAMTVAAVVAIEISPAEIQNQG